MKKIFFLALMAFTVTANAQQGQQQIPKPIDPMAFNPGIFTPIPIGTTKLTVAYIKAQPTSSAWPTPVDAYVQMVGANGSLVEVLLPGYIVNTPGNWGAIKFPKILACKVTARAATTPDGTQYLLDEHGKQIPNLEVIF